MKLDNEEQREQLLGMLAATNFTVNLENVDETRATITRLHKAIKGARLEPKRKAVRKSKASRNRPPK